MSRPIQKGFSSLAIIFVILVVAVLGFIGWRVYEGAREKRNNRAQAPLTDENELVTTAAREYCDSRRLETDMYFTLSNSPKPITYSTDRAFARASVRCVMASLKNEGGSGGVEYILTKKNGVWVVLYADIENNPAREQAFGVPAEFE